jgi:SprT protein
MAMPRTPDHLRAFLPPQCGHIVDIIRERLACDVVVTRPRRSKLGDHLPPGRGRPRHRITINEDLNPYAFLTTLLHEVAHATTWERYRSVRFWLRPHGPEWQREFKSLVTPVIDAGVLPPDVTTALANAMTSPRASSCTDRQLSLALARHDPPRPHLVRVEELAVGTVFRLAHGEVFRAGRRLRTRRSCIDCRTGQEYRVHGLALVEPLETSAAERISGSARRSARPVGRTRSAAPAPLRGAPRRRRP